MQIRCIITNRVLFGHLDNYLPCSTTNVIDFHLRRTVFIATQPTIIAAHKKPNTPTIAPSDGEKGVGAGVTG